MPIAIVASERGLGGARLVAIDSAGDRQYDLIAGAGAALVREANPAVSPDGAWLVFASSRGGALDHTRLWIAPLAEAATAHPLVPGGAPAAVTESHPTWTPDGRAVVFASTAAGGDFDLWRVPVAAGRATGPAVLLADRPGHEIVPSVAPDGRIAFAAVTPAGNGTVTSRIELLAPDGSSTPLTTGPADTSPAVAPDGSRVAFSRPVARPGGAVDAELWIIPITGDAERAASIADVPVTDESGPTWSRDGRFVLATSVLRGDADRVLYSSVIHIDLREPRRVPRMLADRAGDFVRLTPVVVAAALDPAALHADPAYLPELSRIMAATIEAQRSER